MHFLRFYFVSTVLKYPQGRISSCIDLYIPFLRALLPCKNANITIFSNILNIRIKIYKDS